MKLRTPRSSYKNGNPKAISYYTDTDEEIVVIEHFKSDPMSVTIKGEMGKFDIIEE